MRKILFIAILMAAGFTAAGQDFISVRGGATTMLYDKRYYPDLFGPSSPVFPSATFKVGWADNGTSRFRPEYGIALSFDGIGLAEAANDPGVGSVYSLYGFLDKPFIKAGCFSLGFTTGFGLGFVFDKLYDPVTNPWNEIFSSPINAHISLGLQSRFDISQKYYTGLGLYFNHTSNGSISWYNRGYNGFELALTVGMKDFGERRRVQRESRTNESGENGEFRRKFQFDLQASGGVMICEDKFLYTLEHDGVGDNQLYFKYAFQGDALYKYSKVHASGIGFDLFVTPFCDVITQYADRGEVYQPVSCGVSLLHEFSYRNLTATVGVGRYLYDNDGLARNKILYQLVNIRYHFPQLSDLYVGIVLKAHKFMAAECVQYCLGKRF